MNKIGFPLFIMGILTILSVIIGNNFISVALENFLGGSVIVNGTEQTWEASFSGFVFEIDPIVGAIAIISVIAIIVGAIGIQILGSGLSESGHRSTILCIIYGGLWFLLSALSSNLITSIEVFGTIIYISLSLVYVYGVIEKLAGSV